MANTLDISVTPKQRMFMDARQDEVLYGGAAGGGKSYVQLLDALVYGVTYKGIKQLILRRTFPELERSLIRNMLEIYPQNIYTYNTSKHTLTFRNGSLIDFGFCDNEKDVYKYQSSEYDVIRMDECTHFTGSMYEYLRTRIRGANDYPKQMKCSTNPGNVGHQYFKGRFIDIAPPMETYTTVNKRTGKASTRLFIPSRVYDNTFLMEKDPDYIDRLESMENEDERKALLEGSWDLYEGQFFPEFNRSIHVIESLPCETKEDTQGAVHKRLFDKNTRIYFTMDYGLDMFAGYFIGVDNHERAYVFGEIYEPNVIISDAAKMIKQKQKELGIQKVDEYLAPSDLWNRRQESGLSMADLFYQYGIRLYKTSRDRVDGWAATKEWLKPFKDEFGDTIAKIRIHQSCVNLIRCLPQLQYDSHRPNDVAVTPHEITHAPDALRGFCVYRSRANREPVKLQEAALREDRELQRFVSNDMFDVYGGKDDDSGSGSSGDYNPMYL